ncbi:MAG: hypothetical protein JEZ05_10825 [Tenericutes bacterium]|nr:hypothetical protein [Mycoplasmatota bacterium]
MSKSINSGKLFYKYQPIDDNLLDNLSNNQLYFNSPTKFNDPFDCKFNSFYRGKEEDWINAFKNRSPRIIKQMIEDNLKSGIFKRKGNEIAYNPTNRRHIDIGGCSLHGTVSETSLPRVCCFSETADNILLWSHYADCHKGVCLIFRSIPESIKLEF